MMRIEVISPDNIPALTDLTLALWPDCAYEEEFDNWHAVFASDKETCYLVVAENAHIGFIHVSLRYDYVEGSETSPTAYIEGIYVKEDFRKRGAARMLMNMAENWAIQKGCNYLASDTEVDNTTSIAFHQHNGFSEVNRIVCFIKKVNDQ